MNNPSALSNDISVCTVSQSGSPKLRKFKENLMHGVFLLSALASVLSVIFICVFLFGSGLPAIGEIGVLNFLTGERWHPLEGEFGIFPMIVGSLYVTAGAVIIGVPIGILCAVFLAEYCPPKLYRLIKPMINLLAGIPSIVYGFFGLVVIVPIMQSLFGGSGKGILTASVLLGIMILPTVTGVSEAAIRAVPSLYYEGALALGATHERSIFAAVLPAAKSGITAGIILGIGRAAGEAMAVVMVAGNQAQMPSDITSGVRTLTANIVLEMGYAADGLHRNSLIATGVVLFVFIMIINISFSSLKRGDSK
jgi:phosphate transport system permease protein